MIFINRFLILSNLRYNKDQSKTLTSLETGDGRTDVMPEYSCLHLIAVEVSTGFQQSCNCAMVLTAVDISHFMQYSSL